MDSTSGLHSFKPDVILLALDAHHLAEAENADAESTSGHAPLLLERGAGIVGLPRNSADRAPGALLTLAA